MKISILDVNGRMLSNSFAECNHLFREDIMRMVRAFGFVVLLAVLFIGGCRVGGVSGDRALIGVGCVYEASGGGAVYSRIVVSNSYILAITEAGGLPVVLPTAADAEVIAEYVDLVDGLVLIGGGDIPPSAYGQQKHETVAVMAKERYEFESVLIPMWLKTGKPTLGVCLGMQFVNVASGGTLLQDIPSQVKRPATHRGDRAHHQVAIADGSILDEWLDEEIAVVYSNHHQAVGRLGKNLKIIARSPDGVVEAMERTDGPFGLFVQWHPEMMEDAEHRRAIYSALVEACKE